MSNWKSKLSSLVLGLVISIPIWAGLETPTYISDLVPTNPLSSDVASQGDDHIRNLKTAIKNTFPNINNAMNASDEELNFSVGVTSALQTQINAKLASSSYTAADVLAKIITVDGATSGLDADLLDGLSSAAFAAASHAHSGNDITSVITGTGNVVKSASPTFTGTVTAATINATTLQQGGSGVWTAANDGALSGLDADLLDGISEASFGQLGQAETVSARWAFNGGTSGVDSPFTVDSTFVVTNLNADLLDGSSSAAFATASHAHAATDITSGTLAIARGGTGQTDGTARNITGKAGVAKTLSTLAPSGGSDGDIWYRY